MRLRGQRAKARLYVLEIAIDVSVIEFDGGDDRAFGAIMEKLLALVEECGVVFISLDHEVRAVSEPIVRTEVQCDSPNQHRGIPSRRRKHMRHHRGRRRLAVCPGYHHHALALEKEVP